MYKIPFDPNKPLADYYGEDYANLDYWNHEDEAIAPLKQIINEVAKATQTNGGDAPLSLLDVGCGPGVFLSLAQQAGFKVTGIELNPRLAKKAHARANTEVIVGEFMTVDLGDQRFDVITLLDLIEHVPDPVSVIKRCHDLIKPGGYLVLYTPNHSSLIVHIAHFLYRISLGRIKQPVAEIFDSVHVIFFDVKTLKFALKKSAFQPGKVVLSKYDPSRSNQASGASVLALKLIETISPLVKGQFRILMFARK